MKIRILLIAILSVVLQNVQGQNANRKEKISTLNLPFS